MFGGGCGCGACMFGGIGENKTGIRRCPVGGPLARQSKTRGAIMKRQGGPGVCLNCLGTGAGPERKGAKKVLKNTEKLNGKGEKSGTHGSTVGTRREKSTNFEKKEM